MVINSLWSIGEDGGGLGWNKKLGEKCYKRLVDDLSDEECEVLGELEFGGYVFVMEEGMDYVGDWEEVVECEKDFEFVEYDELLEYVKEVIVDENLIREEKLIPVVF